MSAEFILYHNTRCSKSRAALIWLQERGIEVQVVNYLIDIPELSTITDIFNKLNIKSVRGMMRVKDSLYKELALQNENLSNEDLLQVIAEHPALLERPILVHGDKAAIGRPLENLEAIL